MRESLDSLWRLFGSGRGGAGTADTAVLMVTHRLEPAILEHFARLKRESGLPTFLAYHAGCRRRSRIADLNVTNGDLRALFPRRYGRMRKHRRNFTQGYSDLVTFTAALKPKLAAFRWIWIVEYDVDFTGPWSAFFTEYADSSADALMVDIRRRSSDPGWANWKRFRHPPGLEEFAAFQPVSRLSRRFLRAYWMHMFSGAWAGHMEAIVPTFAAAMDMTMEDLSGSGPFAPAEPRGSVDPSTFAFLPVQSTLYFHERPEAFAKRAALYHPIKPASAPTPGGG